jgi:hypothetical protein
MGASGGAGLEQADSTTAADISVRLLKMEVFGMVVLCGKEAKEQILHLMTSWLVI